MKPNEVSLGDTVKDTISGYEGVAVAISDWLNGCRRIVVQSRALHEGKSVHETFDVEQLELVKAASAKVTSRHGGARTRAEDSAAMSR